MKRAPAILVLFMLAAAIGWSAFRLGNVSLERLAAWPSAPAGVVLDAAPPAAAPPAAGSGPRLVVFLVDGLSAADGLRMPTVERLARHGAYFETRVAEPAWPVSAWATALTGRPPAGHGLWLPNRPRTLPLPNLPALATGGGISVSLAGGDDFLRLGQIWAARGRFAIPSGWEGTGEAVLAAARSALSGGGQLVIIHLEGLHTVAHRLLSGGAPEPGPDGKLRQPPVVTWDEALSWTDVRLAQILDGVDLARTDVIIAGTYGATASGRHGAGRPVPLVLAGPRIAPGVRGQAHLHDLAPTAAALLGLPPALAPEGRVLAEAITAAWPPAAAGEEPVGETAAAAETAGSAAAGAPVSAWRALWHELGPRLPWLLLGLLFVAGYGWAVARQPFGPAVWSGALTYLAVNELAFLALGGRYSPDLPGLEQVGMVFWQRRLLETGLAMGAAALWLGWRLARRGIWVPVRKPRAEKSLRGDRPPARLAEWRPARLPYVAVAAMHATLLAALLLGLQAFFLLFITGWEAPQFPGVGWAVKYFLDLSRVVALTWMAPAWALAAVAAAWAAGSLYPPEETEATDERWPTAAGMPLGRGAQRTVVPLPNRRKR